MKLNRNFSLLLLGQSLANIGDVLYIVSVISTIFLLTDSAIAASFVPFTIASSMFISSMLTPLLVEKLNLKWLLAGSQIAKTMLLFILGLDRIFRYHCRNSLDSRYFICVCQRRFER